MKRDQRLRQFRAGLTRFMDRAEVGDTELGRRIGVSRLTVRRWREGESLPAEPTIRKLRTGLRWVDSAGAVREMADSEVEQLLVAAGYHRAPAYHDSNRMIPTDRCVVYTNRYSPDVFPSRWSNRVIELERSLQGSIYTMWGSFPSITRPAEFYTDGYRNGLYDRDNVEGYIVAHTQRQQEFIKRLDVSEVHHLYSLKGLEDLFCGSSAVWEWQTPREVLVHQVDNVVRWLQHDNFELRLRRASVQENVTIIGHHVVLVEFSRFSATKTTENVMGLEIIGAEATVQFTKQFRSFWSDEDTIKNRDEVVHELRTLQRKYLEPQ
jgi:hypothetical protein